MPPKGASTRGRPRGTRTSRPSAESPSSDSSNPFDSSEDHAEEESSGRRRGTGERIAGEEEAAGPEKSIPKDLLTRILHEFFTKDSTRISRDANAAVGKYVDIFVREAIARAAVEKNSGFLEVSCGLVLL